MKHIKGLLTDPDAKYVFLALCWFAGLVGIITGLVVSAFIPFLWLSILCLVLLAVGLFGWMFVGCVAVLRMMRVS